MEMIQAESPFDDAVGSPMLFFLMSMILISFVSLLIQSMRNDFSPMPTRKSNSDLYWPRERRGSATIGDLLDSIGLLSSLDSTIPVSGNDVPFELVKTVSTEFSRATTTYLKHMESSTSTSIQ